MSLSGNNRNLLEAHFGGKYGDQKVKEGKRMENKLAFILHQWTHTGKLAGLPTKRAEQRADAPAQRPNE